MPTEVILPKVDMDMTAGTLSVWHVAEGQFVAKGAPLFDIETDKSAMEVESPASGHVHNMVAPGQSVAVGAPVAWIYAPDEAVTAPPASAAPAAATRLQQPRPAAPPPSGMPQDPRVRATPAARQLAHKTGVDLRHVAGSGPKGRVQRGDIANRAPALSQGGGAVPSDWSAQSGDLHVTRRAGRDTAPLFLIHGFAAEQTGWAPLERALPKDQPLLRLDLPSHGKSPRRSLRSFAELARAVVAAFDASGTEQVHLVGHSLGGALALALADIRPRKVASLTLIAPAGLGPEIDAPVLRGIARASRAESLLPWLRCLTADPEGLGEDYARAALRGRLDPQLRAAQLELAGALFPDDVQAFDLTAALRRVRVPTALVWGRADRIIPWRHALAARGDMALHLLPDCGHIPHVDTPETVAGILARQLA
ncbi:acetoin dehydrogenase dihydrolipoyllysine-residue acetyltransferase subunit [Roseinatronobacter sp. NSM]|uniref:acetoin dehydrogenase dihydrolipoyllysine-residue acetyltransferase subunit n=1 Tax=Roseinatronobacter sp. NSM TaxID=3457785 RepID=UPI0040355C60